MSASSHTDERAKVLVVDDEPDIVESVTFCLEQEGFDVRSASNGYEALGAARSWQPNVVLLDVMMPGENGYRVSRFIQEDVEKGALPPMRVLLVTARKLDEPDREELFARFSRSDGVIYKPFDMEELIAKVVELTAAATA